METEYIVLGITLFFNAIITGLFFGWVVSVIPGFQKIDDTSYVVTMQHINKEILNPFFLFSFVISPILLVVSSILFWGKGTEFILIFLAMILIVVGQFIVTGTQNVPLNNKLETQDLSDITEKQASEIRGWYEKSWNRWNMVRTFASLFSLILIITVFVIS